MNKSVSIVDYGVGNINSVANMLLRAGAEIRFARNSNEVRIAERIILPGVGAFDSCRRNLGAIPDLAESILEFARSGRPLLGICVGMQLLGSSSEEGVLPGLDIIPGKVRRFPSGMPGQTMALKVPHMGWSSVDADLSNPLFAGGLADFNRFYFVHSYYFDATTPANVAAWCEYGLRFAASIRKDNVFGAQFHPEKSHRFGLQMFRNFIAKT
ncbi:imidazole glycerol phosphate synthase subunit HisH [Paucibacter aquatile]|uniref:Imidazole glycerol phosphate synthase subunit HisH n=1 Tax=Kinneretia aquatilis TaxID=2070761 RepID=A0A2N8KWC8_9BURK|nr:imidazole glycerol phosphate synthase subunit HisH [Paucibacter aquatile]PND37774.1 imidazole glycerol phosphate synthase subunit HisH [Paucibacter aquatile]